MQTRRIGDVQVGAIGLGGMPMSIEGRPDEQRSVAAIHAALDAGVTLIDTADAYHRDAHEVGHNETLIARAVAGYGGDTSAVLIATKGGHLRPGDGTWTLNGSPEYLKQACDASLKRLGVEAIGLYQFHRPDPRVPYADSVGALRGLLGAGQIRHARISDPNPQPRRTPGGVRRGAGRARRRVARRNINAGALVARSRGVVPKIRSNVLKTQDEADSAVTAPSSKEVTSEMPHGAARRALLALSVGGFAIGTGE